MTAGVWQDANTNLDQMDILILVSSLTDGWKPANDILGQSDIDINVIDTGEDWKPANVILDSFDFNVNVIVPQDDSWRSANTPLGQTNFDLNIVPHPVPPEPPTPLPDKIFAGRINSVVPTQFKLGENLKFSIAFEVITISLFEQINGWYIDLIFKLDTMVTQTIKSTMILGSNVNKVSVFNFDFKKPMPNNILKGTIIMSAYKGGFSTYQEVVETKAITVTLPGVIPPDENDGLESALPWIVLGLGALILLKPKK